MRKGWGRGGEREWSEENERPLGKIGDYLVWGGVQCTILHPLPTCEMVGASTRQSLLTSMNILFMSTRCMGGSA